MSLGTVNGALICWHGSSLGDLLVHSVGTGGYTIMN